VLAPDEEVDEDADRKHEARIQRRRQERGSLRIIRSKFKIRRIRIKVLAGRFGSLL
jgi:hypothetical protein